MFVWIFFFSNPFSKTFAVALLFKSTHVYSPNIFALSWWPNWCKFEEIENKGARSNSKKMVQYSNVFDLILNFLNRFCFLIWNLIRIAATASVYLYPLTKFTNMFMNSTGFVLICTQNEMGKRSRKKRKYKI